MIVSFLLAAMLSYRPGESRQTLAVGGRERSFILYTPDGVGRGEPLVIALHGRLGTGSGMERLTHLERVAAREKFLLIYPDGVRKSWNDGRETPAEKEGVDDVAFLRTIIDSAVRNCGADEKRIYITGISNGGFMAMRVAAELSDRIAAVAVVAATMDEGTVKAAQAAHTGPVSVLLMQGTKDPLVPFEGGTVRGGAAGPILSHDSAVKWWVAHNGCEKARITTVLADTAKDGTIPQYRIYDDGANGTEVVEFKIVNGGHTWPGGWQYLPVFVVGKTSRNLDASVAIWAFFKRHTRV